MRACVHACVCAGAFLICHLLCRLPSPGCPFELVWFWGNQLLACVQRVCAIAVTFTTAAHATDNSYDHLTNSTAEYVVWSVGTMNRTTQPTHAASCWLLPSTAVTAVITCHNLLTLPGTPKDSNNNCARHARSQTKGSTDFCDLVSNPPAQLRTLCLNQPPQPRRTSSKCYLGVYSCPVDVGVKPNFGA